MNVAVIYMVLPFAEQVMKKNDLCKQSLLPLVVATECFVFKKREENLHYNNGFTLMW